MVEDQDAWLEYISSDPHKAEFYLLKYLQSLPQKDLEKLMKEFRFFHPEKLYWTMLYAQVSYQHFCF